MTEKYLVGTRIRFVRTLEDPASGDRPAFVYAYKGEDGVIVSHEAEEGYMVQLDCQAYADFGCSPHEFEVIPDIDTQHVATVTLARLRRFSERVEAGEEFPMPTSEPFST